MSPVRAQGINMALRDVIVVANHLVPLLRIGANCEDIDLALSRIQAEREPEIIRAQQLQAQEARSGQKLRNNVFVRLLMMQIAPFLGKTIQQFWVKGQYQLRAGVITLNDYFPDFPVINLTISGIFLNTYFPQNSRHLVDFRLSQKPTVRLKGLPSTWDL
jgi:hypothetical protein